MYKAHNDKSIVEILKHADKCVGEARNSLGEFIRKILAFNNVTFTLLGKNIDDYTLTIFEPNDKLRSSAKSNAFKAIAVPEPTWNTFLRFGQIMNFKEMNFTVHIVTEHDQVQFYQSAVINTNMRPIERISAPVEIDPLSDLSMAEQLKRARAENEAYKAFLRSQGHDNVIRDIECSVGD